MTEKISIDALNAHLGVDGWSAMKSLTADEVNSVVRELLSYRTAANPLQAVVDRFPGVKVKPIEFKGPGDEQVYYGEQGGFVYTVRPPSRTPGWRVWVALTAKDSIQSMVGGLIVTMKAETREAAFAAAQADFERRILSALETTPAPVSEITEEMVKKAWVAFDQKAGYSKLERLRAAVTAAMGGK